MVTNRSLSAHDTADDAADRAGLGRLRSTLVGRYGSSPCASTGSGIDCSQSWPGPVSATTAGAYRLSNDVSVSGGRGGAGWLSDFRQC
jgi:hypothetical protein